MRDRYYLRLQMPATSGNKAHYRLWALECNGVGGAKASRDNSINNKVNLYICGDKGETVDNCFKDNLWKLQQAVFTERMAIKKR
ncbi:MAG: baseplate J/gp47 family protein [Clostridia bacterium]|nr:baseplate J/gp47 family protein [Clostridia bacterium]